MNSIRHEAGGSNFYYVFIQDKDAPPFSLEDEFYRKQLEKQIMSNILKGKQWGRYTYLPLDDQPAKSLKVEHAYVDILKKGELSSLKWFEGPLDNYYPKVYPNKELCTAYYAPLNFR